MAVAVTVVMPMPVIVPMAVRMSVTVPVSMTMRVMMAVVMRHCQAAPVRMTSTWSPDGRSTVP